MMIRLRPQGDRIDMFAAPAEGVTAETREKVRAFIASGPPVGWTTWNPLRPAPADRNVSFSRRDMVRRGLPDPPVIQVLVPSGLAKHDQLRVVLCEGASFLEYVTALREEPFEDVHHATLRAVIPAMRRRFLLERGLAFEARARFALEAALDALAAPAFVVDRHGVVDATNVAGGERLARDRNGTITWLRDCLRQPILARVTPIIRPGEPARFLVVERAEHVEVRVRARLDEAAKRMALTARRRAVLELISRGMSNKAIAAELAIAETTVEQHVGALMDAAGVESRAALIAQLLWGGR